MVVFAIHQHESATAMHMSPPSRTSLPSPTTSHSQGSSGDADRENRFCGCSVGGRGWDKLRQYRGNIYIIICKTDSQWEFAV